MVTSAEVAKPPLDSEIPSALYSCGFDGCAEEVSNPADRMYWVPGESCWYCEDCLEELGGDPEIGIRLDRWIRFLQHKQCAEQQGATVSMDESGGIIYSRDKCKEGE